MVNLKKYGLDKNLKEMEKVNLPTQAEIEKENAALSEKEAEFEKKFKLKKRKHAKRKKARR
jgi:hypothetical protein